MALEGQFDDQYGVTHNSAYHVLSEVVVDNLNENVALRVNIFSSEQARNDGADPIRTVDPLEEDDAENGNTVFSNHFSPDSYSGDNPHKIGYDYIKNLNRFSSMIDV